MCVYLHVSAVYQRDVCNMGLCHECTPGMCVPVCLCVYVRVLLEEE
jgi:hypothetical protein